MSTEQQELPRRRPQRRAADIKRDIERVEERYWQAPSGKRMRELGRALEILRAELAATEEK